MRKGRGAGRRKVRGRRYGGVVPMFSYLPPRPPRAPPPRKLAYWGRLVRVVATDDPRSVAPSRVRVL